MKRLTIIIILILLAILFGWLAFKTKAEGYVSLEECFLYQPNIVYIPTYQVLGVEVSEELYRIIACESSFNPDAKNPKSTAYGLCQFLDSTWEYVEKKWAMDLNRYSPEDQLYACERLLREEGLIHWQLVINCIYE